MKITMEPTTLVVTLLVNGVEVPARVWEGQTESGIACHAFVTRISVDKTSDCSEFERELQEQKPPSVEIAAAYAFMLRMVL